MIPSCLAQDMTDQFYAGARIGMVLRALDARDEGAASFDVIRHPGPSDSNRPLFVLIHPGDLEQSPFGWGSDIEARAAQDFWSYTGSGTLKELRKALREGHHVALLHRSSSLALADPEWRVGLETRFWKALSTVHNRHTTLWGDDLDIASAWMIEAFDVAHRPAIHLAGAYSDPKHGCVSAVGKAFLRAMGETGPDRLTVSPFSPPDNGPGLAWRPDGAPVEMEIPEDLRALYAQIAMERA